MQKINPAQAWACNNDEQLSLEIENYLQNIYCKPQCQCKNCEKIKLRIHPNIIYLKPLKNQYVISDIEVIFNKILFSLNQDEKFFFIIENAERLSPICANKLLKTVEEPPTGFHFIFTTSNISVIPKTILSRCTITQLHKADSNNNNKTSLNKLIEFFKYQYNPLEFEKELKKNPVSEQETINLLNLLLEDTEKKIVEATIHNSDTKELYVIFKYLKQAFAILPQPGGSSIFWKNLYLSFPKK